MATLVQRKPLTRRLDLTAEAARQLRTIMAAENKTGWVVILDIMRTPCDGGDEYLLDLAPYHDSEDKVFRFYKIDICIPQANLHRLVGSTLHYDGKERPRCAGLLQKGFVINNPNVKGQCRCGCVQEAAF